MSTTQSNMNKVSARSSARANKFFFENQKSLAFIGSAIVILVLIYFAYQRFYLAPREIDAADQMHVAQDYWNNKEWDKAIKGDAGYPGFEKIISEYSNTKSANLGYYYLGIAYLNKGEYGKAIENLTNYHGTDVIIAAEALGSIGDAYVELKDYDKAITYFKKAADKGANRFTSALYLKKLGLVYEQQQNHKDAAEAYKKIKKDYPESTEAANIDAYIARAEARL